MAQALDKALAVEPYSYPHHADGDAFEPARCPACEPDLWVVYAIGVALPGVTVDALEDFLGGLQGLQREAIAVALGDAHGEHAPPDVRRAWLELEDRQRDERGALRAQLEPGWWRNAHGRWLRSDPGFIRRLFPDAPPLPPSDPSVEVAARALDLEHARERATFVRASSPASRLFPPCAVAGIAAAGVYLAADPALLNEIRFGAEPRKARALQRAAFRKGQGVDPSWLL